MPRAPRRRIRPIDAVRAMRALLRNPDDTEQAFRIVDALSENSGARTFRRFRSTDAGARILLERRELLKTLCAREALEALPPGSLGRVYADFVTREQISADGLVTASVEARRQAGAASEEQRLVLERLRDMHDLWHVVSGYGRDLLGEASLLAFTYGQTRNRGVGFIVAIAWYRLGALPGARRLVFEAWRRGRRARWLPAADWEALLSLPLGEVRARLGVDAPPTYTPLRSSKAPTLAY